MPSTPRTARERARAAVMADLLVAARARLAADGPAGLSLRAIARDLGMVSSAVYRYVPSRDALLTLLVIDAYDAVGEAVEHAHATSRAAGHTPARTWLEVARAFRVWARGDRSAFELVYGTPVRAYEAPQDTVRAAIRLWLVLAAVLDAGLADGTLDPAGPELTPDAVARTVTPMTFAQAGLGPDAPHEQPEAAAAVARSLTLFAGLVGAVSAELFAHTRGVAADDGHAYDVTVATLAAGVGLRVDPADLDAADADPGNAPQA